MKHTLMILATIISGDCLAQTQATKTQTMTPELLWELGRVSGETVTPDGKTAVYGVSTYSLQENKSSRKLYSIAVNGGEAKPLNKDGEVSTLLNVDKTSGKITFIRQNAIWQMNADQSEAIELGKIPEDIENLSISPDGKKAIYSKEVLVQKLHSKDIYSDLPKADAYVFTDLNYRHWDAWEDGKFSHLFIADYNNGKLSNEKDLLAGEAFDVPQKPFGGLEDMIFSPDSKSVIYVCKRKSGKAYALSTNTDLYEYDISTGKTTNLSEGMMGYDTQPVFSKDGKKLAWLSMAEDGNESDKNDIILLDRQTGNKVNLTEKWDESVASIRFGEDDSRLFFLAVHKGTEQLFYVDFRIRLPLGAPQAIKQITKGQWDVNAIIGQSGQKLVVSRTDMNHAAELYTVDLKNGAMQQLTKVNDKVFTKLNTGKVEERHIKTTDGRDMLAWVIYPPDFDPAKKYPTLLYCQGGPQSALSQFYSYRWNFQLMAAQGYIIIAPNRRGMPGHGVEWNKQISGDWGGQAIKDYLSAIDDLAKEPYVDKTRLGAVGASYGGYSVFMLAAVHENRFKTFIAHDGLFDLRSWYGTTEELWFANKDIGGNYWDINNNKAQKSYEQFSPSNMVEKWNTPIMIVQGGKDFRVGIEQGLQAFQAAQLKAIKSKLLYLPEENHWVLKPQNAIVWQREFFNWLKETL
jgi:dipeptidyl aminopeptidase/acylaminoacyl peptidase